jgi:hypothetical protein
MNSQAFSPTSAHTSSIIRLEPIPLRFHALCSVKHCSNSRKPSRLEAHPRCVSSTCPRFIRPGTPVGLSTMSIGFPSSRKGISSIGTATHHLCFRAGLPFYRLPSPCAVGLPRPTIMSAPADKSVLSSREDFTSTTLPRSPCGILSEVSFTSRDFSPKIARSSRSSGVNSFSPLGDIFPTRISLGPTSAPIRIMPRSSRSLMVSSPTFGISRVISSGPGGYIIPLHISQYGPK